MLDARLPLLHASHFQRRSAPMSGNHAPERVVIIAEIRTPVDHHPWLALMESEDGTFQAVREASRVPQWQGSLEPHMHQPPDSRRISFSCGDGKIYVVDSDTGHSQVLYENPEIPAGKPLWSLAEYRNYCSSCYLGRGETCAPDSPLMQSVMSTERFFRVYPGFSTPKRKYGKYPSPCCPSEYMTRP